MKTFLLEYGLFLAKSLTALVCLLLAVVGIAAAKRAKMMTKTNSKSAR